MKTKILALLFLIAIVAAQAQFIAYAAEPPGLTSPFGDETSDDEAPPALTGGDDTDDSDDGDEPPALTGGDDDADDTDDTPDGDDVPDGDDTSDDDDSSEDGSPLPSQDDDDDSGSVPESGSGSTGGNGGDNEVIAEGDMLSETGPAMGLLIIPSIVLGYAYKRKK